MSHITTFEIERVRRLRRAAAEAAAAPEDGPEGWTKSRVDPMRLLAAFPALLIRAGYVLRAYQFREGGNGNGVVWALPADADFPAPEECPHLDEVFLAPPKPPAALDNLMDAITGDGSPWSYLSASLFLREALEFGAMWHGVSWGTHEILGDAPWRERESAEISRTPAERWRWKGKHPDVWPPSVRISPRRVTVTFHTWSQLDQEAINQTCDRYRPPSYAPECANTVLASGEGGFVF
jgi:hypothetical protein